MIDRLIRHAKDAISLINVPFWVSICSSPKNKLRPSEGQAYSANRWPADYMLVFCLFGVIDNGMDKNGPRIGVEWTCGVLRGQGCLQTCSCFSRQSPWLLGQDIGGACFGKQTMSTLATEL